MKRILLMCGLAAVMTVAAFAQAPADQVTRVNLSQAEVDKIIKGFTAKEETFRGALNNYSFQREAIIQTIGFGGQVTGEYNRKSLFTFDDSSRKYEKILYFPISTLKDLLITPQDLEDLGGVNPFALEPDKISLYNITFVGKQKIDELDLYVFDVGPKVMPEFKKTQIRLFQGRIWVDDRDLQIVKAKGKGVPEDKNNKFPIVETWRENVDGKYWFPSYATSNDTLEFGNGSWVKLRIRIKYTDYKEAIGVIRILDDDEDTEEKPQASPSPAPAKKP